MSSDMDVAAVARSIIDANRYMTLGTVDGGGEPWVSPVFYAADGYTDLYWVSSPDVTHSRNIAGHPRVSIVVFDSQVQPGTGQAVYMSATAGQVPDGDLGRGLEVYPGPAERGARPFTPDDVRPPSPYRLYRARVSEHFVLCPRHLGQPCPHGRPYDHRMPVTL